MIAQFKHRAYKQAICDRLAGTSPEARIPDGGRTQRIFNRTMFVVMGKLAKLDGLVVDGEIQYATRVKQLLDLNGLQFIMLLKTNLLQNLRNLKI